MTTEQGAPEARAWKTVPVEPTEAMVEAHFAAHAKAKTVFAEVCDVWAAMLAASPSPPPVGVGIEWATPESKAIGWTLEPSFLGKLSRAALEDTGYGATIEVVEHVFLAGLRSRNPAPPVGGEVVKLEWKDAGHGCTRADTPFGEVFIEADGCWGARWVAGGRCSDPESAKVAAQADYKRRCDATRAPSSPSLLEEVGEALRKAAKPFVEFSELSGFDRMPADMPITAGSRMAARQLTAGDLRSLIEVLAKLGVSS